MSSSLATKPTTEELSVNTTAHDWCAKLDLNNAQINQLQDVQERVFKIASAARLAVADELIKVISILGKGTEFESFCTKVLGIGLNHAHRCLQYKEIVRKNQNLTPDFLENISFRALVAIESKTENAELLEEEKTALLEFSQKLWEEKQRKITEKEMIDLKFTIKAQAEKDAKQTSETKVNNLTSANEKLQKELKEHLATIEQLRKDMPKATPASVAKAALAVGSPELTERATPSLAWLKSDESKEEHDKITTEMTEYMHKNRLDLSKQCKALTELCDKLSNASFEAAEYHKLFWEGCDQLGDDSPPKWKSAFGKDRVKTLDKLTEQVSELANSLKRFRAKSTYKGTFTITD